MTTNTINYHGKQVPIYGGAWNDSMNSCFYDVIGTTKGYDICRSTSDPEEVFALENPMAEDDFVTLDHPFTIAVNNGKFEVTIVRAEKDYFHQKWHFFDNEHGTWYRHPEWDEEGTQAYSMPDSTKGFELQLTEDQINAIITNTTKNEEEEPMETNTFTLLNGTTYTHHTETGRYAKTADGKTKRIGKDEYEKAQHEYDLEQEVENLRLHPEDAQAELDKEPCKVEVNSDLYEVAVLNNAGCVDCSHCNVTGCVHRDCMRRNPRNVGGNDRCPRLDNGIKSEAEKVSEATGMELAEAELAVNVQNAKKAPRKARKSKDVAYEGNGVTLTAKQVDFLLDLKTTDQWEGLESKLWTDVICDEIEGQFAGKPMTVGAMISTLCEKGLAERFKGDFTDPTTNRTRKSTYMELTPKGWKVARELGLA